MSEITITLENIPAHIHEALAVRARKNGRSLGVEVIDCLERVFAHAAPHTLKNPPPFAEVGKILKSLENRADRQQEMISRRM